MGAEPTANVYGHHWKLILLRGIWATFRSPRGFGEPLPSFGDHGTQTSTKLHVHRTPVAVSMVGCILRNDISIETISIIKHVRKLDTHGQRSCRTPVQGDACLYQRPLPGTRSKPHARGCTPIAASRVRRTFANASSSIDGWMHTRKLLTHRQRP